MTLPRSLSHFPESSKSDYETKGKDGAEHQKMRPVPRQQLVWALSNAVHDTGRATSSQATQNPTLTNPTTQLLMQKDSTIAVQLPWRGVQSVTVRHPSAWSYLPAQWTIQLADRFQQSRSGQECWNRNVHSHQNRTFQRLEQAIGANGPR